MTGDFNSLVSKDRELAHLFQQPDNAPYLIYLLDHDINDWVNQHNKQYWEVVRFVFEDRGLLGRTKTDKKGVKLSRIDFARILIAFCPNVIRDGGTANSLVANMEKYPFIPNLRNLRTTLDKHKVRFHLKDVEDLLDEKLLDKNEEIQPSTYEEVFADYIQREVDEHGKSFPLSKVCIRPDYEGVVPAISIETYKSESLLKQHLPSHIEAFEFVSEELDKTKFYEYAGKYYDKRNVKLFIVSTYGLRNDVKALASDKNIGYVRLNKDLNNIQPTYILPRYIEDNTNKSHVIKVLCGEEQMTTPFLVWDGKTQTSSLADVLTEFGVVVKEHRQLFVPYITEEYIEQQAQTMTCKIVDEKISYLRPSDFHNHKFNIHDIDFSIDPFALANEQGISYEEVDLRDDSQLGKLDVNKKQISLNISGSYDLNRYRFTMAHEIGHYSMHYPLFVKHNIYSIGENAVTLKIGNSETKRLEYQANKFASYLLMPEKTVKLLYMYYYKVYVQDVYGGDIHYLFYSDKQSETWRNYNNVVGNMAMHLKVSMTALNIRLQSMGLLKVG